MTTAAEDEATSLPLAGQQTLVIENDARGNRLRILDPHGQVTLSVKVAEAGRLVLRFENGLQMRTEGHLEFEAQRVAIRGREEVRIESGADAHIQAAGDLNSEARSQNVRARLGNLNLKANDDVDLQGEQVRVNC